MCDLYMHYLSNPLITLKTFHCMNANCRYMAPEYFMHGIVNEKTDVFAFGVLLLELITGRRAVDSSQQNRQSLVMWVRAIPRASLYDTIC